MKEKVLTLGTIRDYITQYFPELLWWDGINKHEVWNGQRSFKHRQGMPNEIRIEFDSEDNKKNWEAINFTALELDKRGISFAIFYVEGGRSPHLHIYNIDELESLNKEQRTVYRTKFIKELCGSYEPDYELCDEKHLCALEFANHFKYNKPKQLLNYFWNGNNMGIDLDIKLEILHKKEKKVMENYYKQKKLKFGDIMNKKPRDLIIGNLNFETVFDKYAVKYKHTMALCPFHADGDGSLSFSNDKGLWKCFGSECGKQGDIITLIKWLKEKKNGDKKRS